MMASLFPLVLDGFPRSGSTTLAKVLSVHPEINCCMEPFHPQRYGGEFNRLALQAGTVEPALGLLQTRWDALKHVWEPGLAWPFTGRQDLNDDLVQHAAKIISTRRRNLLQQIISGYISKHLRFWVGTQGEFRERLDNAYLPPLSVAEAAKTLQSAATALEQRNHLLSTLSSMQTVFYYEDFFDTTLEEQCRQLNRLFLGLSYSQMDEVQLKATIAPYLDRTKYKWANEDVYDRIPGIRLINEQLGNDSTGWLFS